MKKRISSLLLITTLLINCFLLQGVSASGSPRYVLDDKTVKVGDTFTMKVAIAENPGIISLRFKVIYDTEVLKLKSVADSDILTGFTTPAPTITSPYTLRWADSLATIDNTSQGTVVTLTFEALKSESSAFVTVEHTEARNAMGTKVEFSNATANVTIKENSACATGSHTYGNWTVDSEDDKKMSRTCTICGDVEESAVYLAGRSLLFKDIIQMRYYFDFSKFGDDVTETGILIWTEDEYAEADEHNISTAPYKTTNLAQNSKGYYYGDSAGIPAKNMIDKQIAIAYAVLSDGTIEYTEECVFSPVMYSQIILAEGSTSKATMKTLAASLMNYGAAAQNFFNYKTETPMNAWMSDELKAVGFDTSLIQSLPEIDNNKLEVCNDDTVTKRGSSLTFVGNINQNIYFDIKDDVVTDAKVLYWTEAEYKKLDKLTLENARTADLIYETTNSCYRSVFEGVAAKDLRDAFVFAVYYKDAEGNEHYSTLFADGAHDYVRRVVTGNSKQTMKDLAKAFLMYHLAAEEHLLG